MENKAEARDEGEKLEKELELERVVLFSDAVFAIAITLVVIDIKWPDMPESLASVDVMRLLRPTWLSFIAFAISFWYIGRSWVLHLRLCRLLRRYDAGLIRRNLLFLFFIVTFPFTASGVFAHVRAGFLFPVYLYLVNVVMVSLTHFILCRYIIHGKSSVAVRGMQAEKRYVYMESLYYAITMIIGVLISVCIGLFYHQNAEYVGYSLFAIVVLRAVASRKLRKFRPEAK
jgi:uncharacterized membrane protein